MALNRLNLIIKLNRSTQGVLDILREPSCMIRANVGVMGVSVETSFQGEVPSNNG